MIARFGVLGFCVRTWKWDHVPALSRGESLRQGGLKIVAPTTTFKRRYGCLHIHVVEVVDWSTRGGVYQSGSQKVPIVMLCMLHRRVRRL